MDIAKDNFLKVIDLAPLVSIDLILRGENDHYLLGKRNNRPAQGCWFVPGGRIRKNETLDQAFRRICSNELGLNLNRPDATLLGAYDHIYDDNFHAAPDINTHYVVLGYRIDIPPRADLVIDDQHDEVKWWAKDALLKHPDVHENTKAYFRD